MYVKVLLVQAAQIKCLNAKNAKKQDVETVLRTVIWIYYQRNVLVATENYVVKNIHAVSKSVTFVKKIIVLNAETNKNGKKDAMKASTMLKVAAKTA
tara:strand:+ start:236 stop:526 length:291 start_codon:yes stop_codon:yes gene_type:complete